MVFAIENVKEKAEFLLRVQWKADGPTDTFIIFTLSVQ